MEKINLRFEQIGGGKTTPLFSQGWKGVKEIYARGGDLYELEGFDN